MLQIRLAAICALIAAAALSGCTATRTVSSDPTSQVQADAKPSPLDYRVDLNTRADDLFEVTLTVNDLGPENAIYQFASTAPGTYSIADVGRFVKSFSAFSASGEVIPTEQISTNQWRISNPAQVAKIAYAVADTWDMPVEKNPVGIMGGTSMEADHVFFNASCVLGFPSGMQARPIRLSLEYPEDWTAGTALGMDPAGRYLADDYDHVVDSPILFGKLSKASLDVRGSKVEIYTYSMTGKVTSDMILDATRDILDAAGDFLKGLPVDRYTFLFHFGDPLGEEANDKGYVGALEHSYSSAYILDESSFEDALGDQIPSFVAHEFFHVVTPLNIHSEVIEEFNFATPVPSEHLWLYEGTTEWVAQTMQLRSGLIDLEEYLDRMSQKLSRDDSFDKTMSLSELSLKAFTDEGQAQYQNIYQRGALVSALLDLRLLELSGGERGLREVLLELADTYGPSRAFDEATFFDIFAEMTYPEIRTFFDDYVRGTKPLPVKEYFEKVGVLYAAQINTGQMVPSLGLQLGVPDGRIRITGTDASTAACGFETNDAITEINGKVLDLSTAADLFPEIARLGAGIAFEMTVEREDGEHTITCEKEMTEYVAQHVFSGDPAPSTTQLELRSAWTRNLD